MRQSKLLPITPVSKPRNAEQVTKEKPDTPRLNDHDDSFDWSSSAEEELAEFANNLESNTTLLPPCDDESPRKALKISEFASPSKRKYEEISTQGTLAAESDSDSTWFNGNDDVFLTPSTSTKSHTGTADLFSPSHSNPASIRRTLFPRSDPQQEDQHCPDLKQMPSTLALDALSILSPVKSSIPPALQQDLIQLLNRHELRTQGITKGRDIARLAVQAKETKIAELQQRITSLEAERETNRTVIQHLKTDIATSPKKPRRPKGRDLRRSAV